MRKRFFVLIILLSFPLFLHAQEFLSITASPGAFIGPDFINSGKPSFSINSDIYLGTWIDYEYPMFFGLDFLTSGANFSDTKTGSHIDGRFFVFDGVAGGYFYLDGAYLLLGVGAGGYFCPYEGSATSSTLGGFALNLSSELHIHAFEFCNLGFSYKLYGLFGAGWYDNFGTVITLSNEELWLYF